MNLIYLPIIMFVILMVTGFGLFALLLNAVNHDLDAIYNPRERNNKDG